MDKCYTAITEHHAHFTWRIKNFRGFLNFYNNYSAKNNLKSSIFITEDHSEWYMEMAIKKDISFYLCLQTSTTPSVPASYNIYIKGLNNQLLKNYKVSIYHYFPKNIGYGLKKFLSRDEFGKDTNLLVNDECLEIHCDLTVIGKPFIKQIDVVKSQYAADYAKWYGNNEDTDWTFVVGTKVFNVHSVILQSRSPVFAEMFTVKLESDTERLTALTDIKAEVFAKLLEFIYTDHVTNIHHCALDLLIVADNHRLERLKNFCEQEIFDGINVDNASSILIVANRHNAQQLFFLTARFINANRGEVVKTTGFKEIEQNHSDLLGKLFKLLCNP